MHCTKMTACESVEHLGGVLLLATDY